MCIICGTNINIKEHYSELGQHSFWLCLREVECTENLFTQLNERNEALIGANKGIQEREEQYERYSGSPDGECDPNCAACEFECTDLGCGCEGDD